jgi:hypothetical protein
LLQDGKNDAIIEPKLEKEFCIFERMFCFYNYGSSTNIIIVAIKKKDSVSYIYKIL